MNLRAQRLIKIAKRKARSGDIYSAKEAQRLAKIAGIMFPEKAAIEEGLTEYTEEKAEADLLTIKDMQTLQEFMKKYGWSFEDVMTCIHKNLNEQTPPDED